MAVKLFQSIFVVIGLFSCYAYASFSTFEQLKEALCYPMIDADVEVLKRPASWFFQDLFSCLDSGYTYCSFIFGICRPLNCSETMVDATACIEYDKVVHKLGSYDAQVNPFTKEIYGKSFVVSFTNGSAYHSLSGKSCNLSMDIAFLCNRNMPGNWGWATAGKQRQPVNKGLLSYINYDEISCKYTVGFFYNKVCAPEPIQPASVVNVISAGSVLLIMFFVCLTLYCVIGSVYNFSRGSRGSAIIPQSEFWSGLPGYVAEGCRFTCRCCRPDPHTTQYESI